MERQIETLALDVLGYAQPDEDVDDLEDDQRHHGGSSLKVFARKFGQS